MGKAEIRLNLRFTIDACEGVRDVVVAWSAGGGVKP